MISIKRSKNGSFDVAELLESNRLAPLVDHEGPYWEPPVPRPLRDVINCALIPELSWARPCPEGTSMTDIEANAPLLTAAANVVLAHGKLEHAGRHDPATDYIHPGYYLVDAQQWRPDAAPGSPLGHDQSAPYAWITHVVYALLRDLSGAGQWPGLKAYDSWTCKIPCRLVDWTRAIRDLRADMITSGSAQGQAALETGFSAALTRWDTPTEQGGAGRGDWYAAIHSHAFVTAWRRAWATARAGRGSVTAGTGARYHGPYGMSYATHDLGPLLRVTGAHIRLDETGVTLGTYRRTRTYTAQADMPIVRQPLTEEFDQ